MSKKRIAVRFENAETLSGSEQEQFVEDTYQNLEGTGIRGYFVADPLTGWIEWEGDGETVRQKVDEFLNDARVGSYNEFVDKEINEYHADEWYGHAKPDAHRTL